MQSFVRRLTVLSCAVLLMGLGVAHRVRVVVHVPEGTPVGESVYLTGSLESVGEWRADGVKLARQSDGTYAGEIEVEVGETLEFKFNRGGWETVEKNANGSDRENRKVRVEAGTTVIDAKVDRWTEAGDGRAAKAAKRASTVVGELRIYALESVVLKSTRTIRVWLPPGYEEKGTAKYDVLYLHDGQNCFDEATSSFGSEWRVDETLTRLIGEKKVRPIIVVGVDNGPGRIGEYTYTTDAGHAGGGRGAEYARFLMDEVMPLVEKACRVERGPGHTFIGGSSLGGLVSLEIARRNAGVFGGVIAMSPSLWWAKEAMTGEVERDVGGLTGTRVWVDTGTEEGEAGEGQQRNVDAARRLDAALTARGVEHRLTVDAVHTKHNEAAWAARFPAAIEYLLGAEK